MSNRPDVLRARFAAEVEANGATLLGGMIDLCRVNGTLKDFYDAGPANIRNDDVIYSTFAVGHGQYLYFKPKDLEEMIEQAKLPANQANEHFGEFCKLFVGRAKKAISDIEGWKAYLSKPVVEAQKLVAA